MVNDVKKPRKLKRAKMWESRLNFKLKASEYPFKQNKNALKNLTVLLYTSFYNISLNVLRPNFFNRYNLPFLPSHKINQKSKVGAKTNYFWYFRSSYTIRIMFFNNFFHWYVANQATNKTVSAIFFFSNIFWIIYFYLFSCKICFQNSSHYYNKKWMTHY